MGCKSECCGRCLLACDGKGILPPCLFITAPELWARSDYFGLLLFEDAEKEQVILNTNPDFFFYWHWKEGISSRELWLAMGCVMALQAKSQVCYFSGRGSLHPDLAVSSPSLPSYFQSRRGLLGAVSHRRLWVCQTLQWCWDVHTHTHTNNFVEIIVFTQEPDWDLRPSVHK